MQLLSELANSEVVEVDLQGRDEQNEGEDIA